MSQTEAPLSRLDELSEMIKSFTEKRENERKYRVSSFAPKGADPNDFRFRTALNELDEYRLEYLNFQINERGKCLTYDDIEDILTSGLEGIKVLLRNSQMEYEDELEEAGYWD